jgi:predicted component of type VI protein secretion system
MGARHEIRSGGGSTVRTLLIGRSPSADVVIADASLAPHHAELVITDDGRLYLTDCATDGGTWVMSEGQSASGWQPVRQGFVHPDQALRLGDHQCTAGDLVRRSRGAPAEATTGGGASAGAARRRVRGPVARDPATGEIVRRRP